VPSYVIIACLGLLIIPGYLWLCYKGVLQHFGEEWEFNTAYRLRAPLSDEAMIDQFFRDGTIDPAIVVRVRHIFGHQFQLDPLRILPNDDFGRIYADLDLAELVDEIDEAFGIVLVDGNVIPVDGTVRAFAGLVQRKLEAAGRSSLSRESGSQSPRAARDYNDPDHV